MAIRNTLSKTALTYHLKDHSELIRLSLEKLPSLKKKKKIMNPRIPTRKTSSSYLKARVGVDSEDKKSESGVREIRERVNKR